tara:strand:+ start:4197 stop:5363 length:1167 start_codon:yes stop_codon:yes gene_type:complete
MKKLVLVLIIVSSCQLLINLVPFFSFFDELLLSLIVSFYLLSKNNIKNEYNDNLMLASLFLLLIVTVSTLIDFYSVKAFFFKSIFYLRIIFVFSFISILCRSFTEKTVDKIYIFCCVIAFLGILEYVYVMYFDGYYILYNYIEMKFRDSVYRASSITGHPISLSMMSLVALFYGLENKKRRISILVLFLAILCTGTRLPLLILGFYGIYIAWNNCKSCTVILSSIGIALFAVMYSFDSAYYENALDYFFYEERNTIRLIAIEVLKNAMTDMKTLFIGAGVGSFGTKISATAGSMVYYKYNFNPYYLELLKESSSGVESNVVMSLVEMGVIGFLTYYYILYRLIRSNFKRYVLVFLLVIIYSMVYPIYTLPYVYLTVLFFSKKATTAIH